MTFGIIQPKLESFFVVLQQILLAYTKSRLLLDFRRVAQCVSPVCVLACSLVPLGRVTSKYTSLHTAETAMPPFFYAAKSNFKGTFGTNAKQPGSCEPG